MLRTFYAETEEDSAYWRRMARRLQTARATTTYWDRDVAWGDWFSRHAATVVQATADEARTWGWDRNFAYRDITRVPTGPLQPGQLAACTEGPPGLVLQSPSAAGWI